MSFQIWQDEEMTKPLSLLSFNTVLGDENAKKIGKFYFGSNDKNISLKTAENTGLDPILIKPDIRLQEIKDGLKTEHKKYYHSKGYIYKCTVSGTAGDDELRTDIGKITKSGDSYFFCVSKCHSTDEIKLSLSEDGLKTAIAGGAINLGTSIRGGASICIYYEIENKLDTVSNDTNYPSLCISINECVEIANDL